MGSEDASDFGGNIREGLKYFKLSRPAYEQGEFKQGYRYFYLHESNIAIHDNPVCLFDMTGKIVFRDDFEIELLPAYAKCNRNLNKLMNDVISRLAVNFL